ncbi:hypothetical protein Btru_050674 [Bulinus truncatus]|nr:hypothetical protein Btru_050674 [Bulinus truncatus]
MESTTANQNVSSPHIDLDALQHHSTLIFIPAMAFMATLGVIGVIGNSLVMFVYLRRPAVSAMEVLIIDMAVYDLLTNVLVIPGEIYDMLHQWDFDNPSFCRARRFFNVATTIASAYTLIAIGVTRYKRICQPLRSQVTLTQVYIATGFIVTLSLICSLPLSLLNGRHTRNTTVPGLKGYSCDVDDAYADTHWPKVNSVFFVSIYCLSTAMIVSLYGMIWSKAWRHRASMSRGMMSRSVSDSNLLRKLRSDASCMDSSRRSNRSKRLSKSLQTLSFESGQSGDAFSGLDIDPLETVVGLSSSCVTLQIDVVSDSTARESEATAEVADRRGVSRKNGGTAWMRLLSDMRRRYSDSTFRKRKDNQLVSPMYQYRKKLSTVSDAPRVQEACHKPMTSFPRINSAVDRLSHLDISFEIQQINFTNRKFLVRPKVRSKRASQRFSRSAEKRRRRNFGRTSCMLLTISVVFLLSFLPFNLLQFFKNVAPHRYAALEDVPLSVYHLFYRSYLVNCAVNPIIYSLCDHRFRQDALKLLKFR